MHPYEQFTSFGFSRSTDESWNQDETAKSMPLREQQPQHEHTDSLSSPFNEQERRLRRIHTYVFVWLRREKPGNRLHKELANL